MKTCYTYTYTHLFGATRPHHSLKENLLNLIWKFLCPLKKISRKRKTFSGCKYFCNNLLRNPKWNPTYSQNHTDTHTLKLIQKKKTYAHIKQRQWEKEWEKKKQTVKCKHVVAVVNFFILTLSICINLLKATTITQ